MSAILLFLHLVAAAVLILVVLLQSGKAGDLASTFGGATSQTAFGARGAATLLTKATTICAILFMVTSLGLSIIYSSQRNVSVMEEVPLSESVTEEPKADETAPAAPAQEDSKPQETSETGESQ